MSEFSNISLSNVLPIPYNGIYSVVAILIIRTNDGYPDILIFVIYLTNIVKNRSLIPKTNVKPMKN